MYILVFISAVLIGFAIGMFVGRKSAKVDGLFIIDDSDTETTRWILDVREKPEKIAEKKEIRLQVKKVYNSIINQIEGSCE